MLSQVTNLEKITHANRKQNNSTSRSYVGKQKNCWIHFSMFFFVQYVVLVLGWFWDFFLPLLRWSKSYPGSFFWLCHNQATILYTLHQAWMFDPHIKWFVISWRLSISMQHVEWSISWDVRSLKLNKIGWKYIGWIIATLHDLTPKKMV